MDETHSGKFMKSIFQDFFQDLSTLTQVLNALTCFNSGCTQPQEDLLCPLWRLKKWIVVLLKLNANRTDIASAMWIPAVICLEVLTLCGWICNRSAVQLLQCRRPCCFYLKLCFSYKFVWGKSKLFLSPSWDPGEATKLIRKLISQPPK